MRTQTTTVTTALADYGKEIAAGTTVGCVLSIALEKSCAEVVAEKFKDFRLKSSITTFASNSAERVELFYHQQRALRFDDGYTTLVVEPGASEVRTYSVIGEQSIDLGVPAYIEPDSGRMFVPLRLLEYAGLTIK